MKFNQVMHKNSLPPNSKDTSATIVGNADVSILRPENGGTRFLGMFVTTYQPTCCDNQKTTVFAINSCNNLSFLG